MSQFKNAHILYFLLPLLISPVHGTISVISEETNETVRVIYEKNIRAVSDAVEVSRTSLCYEFIQRLA